MPATEQGLLQLVTFSTLKRPPPGLVKLRNKVIEDGIHDGDYLFVREKTTARNGEIAVVMVEGEATVKRFKLWRGKPMLQPENPAFEPIRPDPDQLEILGVVIEVRRTLS